MYLEYFTIFPVPAFQPSDSIERISVLPKEWYDPKEDEEWESCL